MALRTRRANGRMLVRLLTSVTPTPLRADTRSLTARKHKGGARRAESGPRVLFLMFCDVPAEASTQVLDLESEVRFVRMFYYF